MSIEVGSSMQSGASRQEKCCCLEVKSGVDCLSSLTQSIRMGSQRHDTVQQDPTKSFLGILIVDVAHLDASPTFEVCRVRKVAELTAVAIEQHSPESEIEGRWAPKTFGTSGRSYSGQAHIGYLH